VTGLEGSVIRDGACWPTRPEAAIIILSALKGSDICREVEEDSTWATRHAPSS
jgi:hypothetical protein